MKIGAGKIIGAAMFAAGVAAIWLWPKPKAEVAEETVVRPVRSMVVSGRATLPELRCPGRVRAGESRDLMFEVPGRLVEFKIDRGQRVKKGDVLGKLDTRDYEADVSKAEASFERAKLTRERYAKALGKGGVSKEDVSKADADFKTSSAQLDVARKSLASCTLVAPFDGLVADRYPEQLDMISVGQKILTLLTMVVVPVNYALLYGVRR
jgi:RND family efflux transporter MFP subunit